MYEYIITLSREVDLFWKHKITVASVLFFATRYISLVVTVMGLPYDVTLEVSGYLVQLLSNATDSMMDVNF